MAIIGDLLIIILALIFALTVWQMWRDSQHVEKEHTVQQQDLIAAFTATMERQARAHEISLSKVVEAFQAHEERRADSQDKDRQFIASLATSTMQSGQDISKELVNSLTKKDGRHE